MTTTDFGFQQIPINEKEHRVAEIFSSVASHYDLMNDAMSLGMHRWWKRLAVQLAGVREGQIVLDVAGGTGNLTALLAEKVGKKGQVWLSDINFNMLSEGRNQLIDQGIVESLFYAQGNAEQLSFVEGLFDCVMIGFGLRNVTHKEKALDEMFRVLKPGGKLIILEFSKPKPWLQAIYDTYSFNVIPKLGEWLVGDKESYQYLVESIRMHPDQATLKQMMESTGFENCEYYDCCGGIVSIHKGWKY